MDNDIDRDDKLCNDYEQQFSDNEEQFVDNDEHMNKMGECDSFVTSSTEKEKYENQCTDCFVMQHEETGQLNSNRGKKSPLKTLFSRKLLIFIFSPISGRSWP